ncbi:hypothetical protein KBX37_07550 [Micromonospora sp. U56]|uniref:hypothetical protein n=1 Tax=Micromonospora sp. U56 TaxID=2824900 RepID=UPI001B36E5FE|nr:hypothetical protein [Micromonospora sp. U56]MBQ0892956.1 hypothetical protein [Micromonospora sp. U56]
MTGYLAALAALAVGSAHRLQPRTLGRFEPEQPEPGGGFEAYDLERDAPVPPRPATRPQAAPSAPPGTPPPAVAPAPVPLVGLPAAATAPVEPVPAAVPAVPAAPPREAAPPRPAAPEPVIREETTRVLREFTLDRVVTGPPPAGPAEPPPPPAAPAPPPQPAPPPVAAPVVRTAPLAPPTRVAPVTRAAVRVPERPTVHVHIGRIDVRLAPGQRPVSAAGPPVPPAAPPPAAEPGPAPELEAYLRDPGGPR